MQVIRQYFTDQPSTSTDNLSPATSATSASLPHPTTKCIIEREQSDRSSGFPKERSPLNH
ncbi:MAG: hypothetical protein AB4063_26245 [Crocosphaera sp.]